MRGLPNHTCFEPSHDIAAADAATAPSVLVLAEHTFFILDLSGHILVQRRLDHHPSCFWPYPASTGNARVQ